jgi:phosphopantetheinyl transferase
VSDGVVCDQALPTVQLFDARKYSTDLIGLRDLVREACASVQAPCSSRSYRYPFALAAWHELDVGVDLEQIEEPAAGFAKSIQTPQELARSGGPTRRQRPDDEIGQYGNAESELWCSKEALAKALGDATAYDPRRLDSPIDWHEGRCGPWRARQLVVPRGYWGWLVWRSS